MRLFIFSSRPGPALAAALFILGVGCATTPVVVLPVEKTSTANIVSAPPPPPSVDRFDAKGFAATKVSPVECMQGAVQLRQKSVDVGWAALKGCLEKGVFERGNFTNLRMLLSGPWNGDLAERADAPKLAARLIALRGGDVDGDLSEFHKVRLPAFSLTTAMDEPDMYKGRMLIIRGRGGQMAGEKGKPTLRLAEMSEKTVRVWHDEYATASASAQYSGSGTRSSSTYSEHYTGQGSGSASVAMGSAYSGERDVTNQALPTGRQVLGRLSAADPFLLKDQDYVFLVRFDGVRDAPSETDEEHPTKVGVVTILSYFKPAPILIE